MRSYKMDLALNARVVCLLVLLFGLHSTRGQNSGVAVIYDAVTPSSYTVVENAGPLVACIRAIGTVQAEFTVTITTSDQFGSATAGVDYNDIVATVTFEPFSTLTRCSTIPIIDDNVVENEEFFFLSLSSEDTSVSLPSLGTVAITNDDSVSLGFTESSYTAVEGNPAQVCVIILSGSIARNIDFDVTQTDGTASALNEDYVQATLSGSITPAGAASTVCVNVPLNPDTKVEATETIEIHLTSPDSIETSDATIFIMDDDGVTVELDSSMLSVSEGNSGTTMLDLCVHLTALQTSSSIHRDVGLLLTTATTQGQADSDDFLLLSDQPLTIPMSTHLGDNVCYQLEITGDQVCEGDEIFTVSVTPSNSLDTVVGADTVTVTIQDDGDSIEDCGSVSINAGVVQYSSTIVGSTVTYSCSIGYNLVGDMTRVCEATGTLCVGAWSGSDPSCQISNCGVPEMPSNGLATYTTTTYLSVTDYTCNVGYNINGVTSRTCQADEEWSGSVPTCDIIECSSLVAPENGGLTLTNLFFFNSRASYTCNQGYNLVDGATNRICRATGLWTASAPTCDPVNCFGLINPDNGLVTLTGTTFMNTATYSCQSGFALIGDDSRECMSDGQWSGLPPTCIVDCGTLPSPTNGALSFSDTTLLNSVATYTCDEGYNPENGDAMRTCLSSGQWSGGAPTCEPVDCFAIPNPTNGQSVFTTTTLSSMTTFTCDNGYSLSEDVTRVCQSSGMWSAETPTCSIIDCGTLSNPTFGSVSLNPDTNFGSIATYSCINGYNIVGMTTRTCQLSGEWSNEAPLCTIVDCGPPSNPDNGDVTVGTTTFGAIAVYSCVDGYELSTSNVRTCQGDGSWLGEDPSCDPVDCGSLNSPMNGMVSTSPSTIFESTATYTCDNGYTLTGIAMRTCEDDGEWSSQGTPDPTCQAVDCGILTNPTNGLVTFSTTTFLSDATYTCNLGYLLVGVSSRACQANATWSEDEPTCQPVDCMGLSAPDDGMVDISGGTTLNGVADYTCDLGFMLLGIEQRSCGSDGMWTGDAPTCEDVTCPDDRTDPTNGVILVMTGVTFGAVVTYQCNVTYALIGQATQTCGADGMWTNEPPTCDRIGCPIRSPPVNGSSMQLTPTLVQFECDLGFDFDDPTFAISQCELTTGMWSDRVPNCIINDCGSLPDIERGMVQYTTTTYQSEAVYTCEAGFQVEPSSSETRVCQADDWSGVEPTCEPVNCGPLSDPTNGQADFDTTLRGSMATYSCNQNYSLVGDSTRTCMDNSLWSGSQPICMDIDECSMPETNLCEQECMNIDGSYECACNVGFSLVGFSSCVDINECDTGNGGCAQVCNNTVGSRVCDCMEGFTLHSDGVNCNDLDECVFSTDVCHSNATCSNTVGGFNCTCDQGFQGDGLQCTDVDECVEESDNCSQFAGCDNIIGSFTCSCLNGFSGDGQNCQNINECLDGNVTCADNAQCIDTVGSYTCSCNEGFSGDGVTNCTDMNECEMSTDNCDQFASCTNTNGSFSCSCLTGFNGDGLNCMNIDECMVESNGCHDNAQCMDTVGSYTCSCNEGFSGDGVNCTDQCTSKFQLVLSGVGDCSLWSTVETGIKLDEIATKVSSEVELSCDDCNLTPPQIFNSEFSCLEENLNNEITYRAGLRGNTDSDCPELLDEIESWVQENRASITVGGTRLNIASNCEVEIDDFVDPLECMTATVPPVTTGGLGSTEPLSLPVIAGAAVGGLVVVVIVVILFIVIIAVVVSKRKRKSVEIPTHFVDTSANDYSSLNTHSTSNNYVRTHLPIKAQNSFDYGGNGDLRGSTFNPEGDVIPMLARSYSTLSRNRIKPNMIQRNDSKTSEDLVYDDVYDHEHDNSTTVTTLDVEEVYDIVHKRQSAELESSGEVANNPLYDKADLGL